MIDNITKLRKLLIFRSWHRGTREMDLILGSFAEKYVPDMTESTLKDFQDFLEISDPQLYDWYLQKEPVPEELKSDLMHSYLKHKVA
ncbi:MAG: succinate dehydrogenase assembly factor 2 [Rhodospirillales bacterium]|nr:succinate dehydrogenase assembly factor 2 [Rhodospirillales bacterium]MCB9965592.1 succinate dehydrogenase assembly factor 2 [Rhodospirillales bacterium]MCB9979833.1 succinate dehydrogenase assembly factor 2 [Rhodospirillales bacterium]